MNWLLERLALAPDLSRAIRSSVAFGGALLVCLWTGHPSAIPFAATSAQVMCNPQFRGAYGFRLLVLSAMIAIFAGSALLGGLTGQSVTASVLAMAVLSLLAGAWRHLSSDYGQPMTVDSALFFLLALDRARDAATAVHVAEWVASGAAGGSLLQIGLWFLRPQHSLRHGVAECWAAAGELFSAMQSDFDESSVGSAERVVARQRELREMLDRSATALAAANSRRDASFVRHLEKAQRSIAHFAMQTIAFRESLELMVARPEFKKHAPALAAALESLTTLARSGAITLVTHRPENLAATELRLERCRRLFAVLREHLLEFTLPDCAVTQALLLLQTFDAEWKAIHNALEDTVDHSARRALFPFRFPDLQARSLRAIAAGLNPAPAFDATLVRYAVRMAVLTMLAVGLYRFFHIPRGYWMAFAIVVVLQPDYGATRKRAAERVFGTLGGAALGSALLWVPSPSWLLAALAVAMVFAFGYYLKRQYGVAVFFVTLMLVLVTESVTPIHLDFTIGRLLSNAVGAATAFLAALVFWPSWERAKFPTLIAAAIRANGAYLAAVSRRLAAGESFFGEAVQAKRSAERAGNIASASFQRMLSEPARHRHDTLRAAALVASNQRVTNAVTVLAAQLAHGARVEDETVCRVVEGNGRLLDRLAAAVSGDDSGHQSDTADEAELRRMEDRMESTVNTFTLRKISAQIRALALVIYDLPKA